MLSNVSASMEMPNSCAIAGRCKSAFVEPEIAACTMIAFSKLSRDTMSRAVNPLLASHIACCPACWAASGSMPDEKGSKAVPGSDSPSASLMICMVQAVPMKLQAPQEGQALC